MIVLFWTRRHRCQRCGAPSERRTLAGEMVATPEGWLCVACLERSAEPKPDISRSADFEPAPRHDTITAGAALASSEPAP